MIKEGYDILKEVTDIKKILILPEQFEELKQTLEHLNLRILQLETQTPFKLCPKCLQKTIYIDPNNKPSRHYRFWLCTNEECKFPLTQLFDHKRGKWLEIFPDND